MSLPNDINNNNNNCYDEDYINGSDNEYDDNDDMDMDDANGDDIDIDIMDFMDNRNKNTNINTNQDDAALMNINIEEHGHINDSIVQPARRKVNKIAAAAKAAAAAAATIETNANTDVTTVIPRKNSGIVYENSIISRLYIPDRIYRKELWYHIRLVAPSPTSELPIGQYKWRSKDAIAAYCLQCKCQFTYSVEYIENYYQTFDLLS
ncbi:hypothetical protein FRACYDRAFT_238350 [Fragilariopsis cylindrus CCMP1102]|uniref:Uncharacterized protein n=1 Tax=Fragilariopsis cylindrus CCMP1102 TaxID=635003 RepID=A0A1E7FIB6_9STRA|nr:hypothetical protein FRACYDRAFT_238350 [Fragilariopsis cylindrus CCMP1102]|eukprot:OEU17920.1 hypothetical protein FRACYDRAFT_238350 [Fragilariopsis cylindrus CCMP1102]